MKTTLGLTTLLIGAASLHADTPIQLSLTPQIALYPSTTTVRGLALDIWGENPQVGLDIGLVNGSTGESAGASLGLVNYAQSYNGLQYGVVNISTEHFAGLQYGYVNVSLGSYKGLQLAYVNYAEKVAGLQVGLVNYAENLHGLQIGAINIALNNAWFKQFPDQLAPGFPILNWSF